MKIKKGLYQCGFCGEMIRQNPQRAKSMGKKGALVSMVICLKCGNFVSQKTLFEIQTKMAKGERV